MFKTFIFVVQLNYSQYRLSKHRNNDTMKKQEFNLENIPKKNIFQVPENYFEDLSAKIEQRTQSKIENLPKENIFKVPENYFKDLESKIIVRMSEGATIVPLFTWSAKRTWASAAACSAIAILGYFTLIPSQDSLGKEGLAGVKNQEIVNYLIQQDLNQTDVAEQIEAKNIKFKETDLLNNLNISKKDILQNVDLQRVEEEI